MSFDINKYLVHVESPEVDQNKSKREQVAECIMKYITMAPNDNLTRLKMSCKTYTANILDDHTVDAHDVDALATMSIVQAIQAYFLGEDYQNNAQQSVLNEMFTVYCNCVSKLVELKEYTQSEGEAMIKKCYEACRIESAKQ